MNINSRWFYRAAGTVGIAGGFLALAAGTAQADQAEHADSEGVNAMLDDVFSPTSGLPPLDLGGTPDGVPLDGVGLPGGSIGTSVPLDPLADVDGPMVGLTDLPVADAARTLPAPAGGGLDTLPALADGEARTLPAAAAPRNQLDAPAAARSTEIVGPMPALTQPVSDLVLGGRSVGDLVTVGDLAGQVPVAGPVASQTAGNLPLVSDAVPSNHVNQPLQQTTPVDPAALISQAEPVAGASDHVLGTRDQLLAGTGDPVAGVGDQLPALIADELAADGGFSSALFGSPRTAPAAGAEELLGDGGLPLVGDGLSPVSQLVGVGDVPSQLPLVGPVTGSTFDGLPVASNPALAPAAAPRSDPATVAAARPIAGEDPEFVESERSSAESAEQLPSTPVDGLTHQLPVSSPLSVLRTLPVVGDVSGALPI